MNEIRSARTKDGFDATDLTLPLGGDGGAQFSDSRLIQGRALIFWEPERFGEKLDAINTDQVTPANECVSEGLVADNRFAVGSSPKMSPTGLKAGTASALLGYIGSPSELGLDWDPETFGI